MWNDRFLFLLRALCLLLPLAVSLEGLAQSEPLTVEQLLREDAAGAADGGGTRAQLVPIERSTLAAGLSAKVAAVHYSIGESVQRGDVLVEFDCASLLAQEKIYQARKQTSEINLQVKQRLLELNNLGAQELELARAELAVASAELEVIGVELAQCTIRAPFDGTVVSRDVEPHEFIGEGEPVLELQSRDSLEVLLVAPSDWLGWLAPGTAFSFRVEETGESFSGAVLRLGGRVDPVSQTILVFGRLSEPSSELLPGMSGDIRFDRKL